MDVPPPQGFERPAHFLHARSGLRAWLTEPAGVLSQVTTTVRGDLEMARFLSETVSDAAIAMPRAPGQKLVFLHEWSRLVGYTPETRELLTQWGIRIRGHVDRIVVGLGPDTSAIVRMGISVASVGLRLAGVRLELVDSMDEAIHRLGVRPWGDSLLESGS